MTNDTETWVEEVEHYNAEHGSVFVFRWVPHFSRTRETPHPTTAEWAAAVAAASEGLAEGGLPAHRQVYDVTHYGVDGHRPMTEMERAHYRATLQAEIARRQRDLELL